MNNSNIYTTPTKIHGNSTYTYICHLCGKEVTRFKSRIKGFVYCSACNSKAHKGCFHTFRKSTLEKNFELICDDYCKHLQELTPDQLEEQCACCPLVKIMESFK